MASPSGPVTGALLAAAAGAAVLAGTAGAYMLWSAPRGRDEDGPPKDVEWRKVGTLSELYFFPLKSARRVSIPTLEASEIGLRSGAFRDRCLLVVDAAGNFTSARVHPRLELVCPSIEGNIITLRCNDNASIGTVSIDVSKVPKDNQTKIRIWGHRVTGVDCGDEAAAWIRKAVVEKDKHGEATAIADLRVMLYPFEQSDRAKDGNVKDLGLYSDHSSYSLVSQASLDDLNNRLSRPVTVLNFRSNFLVDGPKPYEEDNWKWVRIGKEAVFKVEMPCSRCVMTTVDPETGVKASDLEPLKTLKTYRLAEGSLRKITGNSPILALWMGIRKTGSISVGDTVYVPA